MADDKGANPFGYVDHSPFAAFGAELVYGLLPDGSLTHISQVPRGLACNCLCPACGRTLIARKGKVKVEHFGHHGAGTGCGRNAETNAHSWAKDVLGRERRILLPAVVARIGKEALQTHRERMFRFATATLEKMLDDIVPDVVVTTEDGQQLLVEVCVTHACDPEKIAKLKERGLATLEVDMSAWRKSNDRPLIEAALIGKAPRAWLHNRKQDEAAERLQKQIAQRAAEQAAARRRSEEKAAAEKAAREREERDRLNAKIADVVRTVTLARASTSAAGQEELAAIAPESEFSELLLPRGKTCGFLVPNARWQAALLIRMIDVEIGETFSLPTFDLDGAMRAIDDCIAEPLTRDVPADVRRGLPPELRELRFPREAVEAYLHHLCATGLVQADGIGGFEVEDDRARTLEMEQALWKRRKDRRDTLDHFLNALFDAVPLDEQDGFSIADWERSPVPDFDRTVPALLDGEQAVWSRFQDAFQAVQQMVAGGAPVLHTLGLPLGGEQLRAIERERRAAVAFADAREAKLRSAAARVIGVHASAWLDAPLATGFPVVLARRSDPGLHEALEALDGERIRLAARAAQDSVAAECRALLAADAERKLGPSLAPPFLNNFDARLNATPWSVAVNQQGLRRARAELDRWVSRNRRGRR